MELVFQKQLTEELLRSEKKRTVILISIFLFGFCYQLVSFYFFSQAYEETAMMASLTRLWMFPLAVAIFEIFFLFYISRRMLNNKKNVPSIVQYLHVSIEILLVSSFILSIAVKFPSVNVLQSPAIFIYFLFIIVSTLKLNFGVSFLSGILASFSYICFDALLYKNFSPTEIVKTIIILFCGVIAGLVGRQIRTGINRSWKEAEKRQKVENLFGQQISPEIAEKMIQNDGKIESKRVNVAIMFIDIRNFTNFATNRHPEEIVQFQNTFFSIVFEAVSRHQGVVHQFLGDGCMVTFGAPVDLTNPSQHAVKAAFRLLNDIEDAIETKELHDIKIGIGVHTGEVITGNIGTNQRQQYSITGSVVILASRIEQLNKEYKTRLLVSKDVIDNLQQDMLSQTEFIGNLNIKGWSEPVGIYKVA